MSWVLKAGAQVLGAINDQEVGDAKRDAAFEEAEQMDQQAEQEVAVGSFNTQRLKKRAEQILSSQRAASSKGNQSSTDATSMAIQAETVQNASMDQLLMMAESQEKARTLKKDAEQTRRSGEIMRSEYRGRAAGQWLQAGGTIVEHAEDVAAKWVGTFG